MKRLLFLLGLTVALTAPAQTGGIVLAPATAQFTFTDCAAGGSAAQTVTKGTYLFSVTTEDVFICYAATCASGGMKFGAGVAFMLSVEPTAGQAVSCRSAGATGDLSFVRAGQR